MRIVIQLFRAYKMLMLPIGILLLASLIFTGNCLADNTHPSVKIVYGEFSPFYFKGSDSKPKGILVDFWNLWSKKTKTPVSFHLSSFSEAIKKVSTGEMDIMGAAFYSQKRDRILNFSIPFYRGPGHIFSHPSVPTAQRIKDLKRKRVGLVKKTFTVDFVQRYEPETDIVEYPNLSKLIEAARAGDIKYFIYSTPVTNAELAKKGLTGFFKTSSRALFTNPYQAAITKNNQKLLKLVNKGIRAISKQEIKQIINAWTGESIKPNSKDIEKHDKILISAPITNPPMHFLDEEGVLSGMAVDIWKQWSQRTGIKIEFVPTTTWRESVDMLREGFVDAHISLYHTPIRSAYLDFITPIMHQHISFFFHKEVFGLKTLQDFHGHNIGVLKGSFAAEYIAREAPSVKLKSYNTLPLLLEAAKRNEIKVFVATLSSAIWWLEKKGMVDDYRYHPNAPLAQRISTIAVQKGNRELAALIRTGMSQFISEKKETLQKKWFGTDLNSIEDHVVIGFKEGYAPLAFINSEGQPAGMEIDLWKLWAKKTGKHLIFKALPENHAADSLRSGEIDFYSGISIDKLNKDWFEFSQPINEVKLSIFFPNEEIAVTKVDDLKYKKIGFLEGTNQNLTLKKVLPDAELIAFPTFKTMAQAAKNKTISAFSGIPQVTSSFLTKMDLQGEFSSFDGLKTVKVLRASVIKGNKQLLTAIDHGLAQISKSEHAKIESLWIPVPEHRYHNQTTPRINLSAEEESWLKTHSFIKLGVTPNWPPLEYRDKNNDFRGIFADYISKINERLNITIEPVFLTWTDILQKAKNNEIDLYYGSEKAERKDSANFSKHFFSFPNVIINRIEESYINELNDIPLNHKIAVVKGFSIQERLQSKYPDHNFVFVSNTEAGLMKLANREVEAFAGSMVVASYLIQQKELLSLKIAAPLKLEEDKVKFAVRKDWPEFIPILNKAIDSITSNEHEKIRNTWITIRYEQGIDWKTFWQWVLIVGGILSALLAISLFWNRKLANEIDIRKESELEINRLQVLLKNIINSMPKVLIGIDGEIRVNQWNRDAEKTTGISTEDALGKPLFDVYPPLKSELPIIKRALEYGENQVDEKALLEQSESSFYANVTIYPLLNNTIKGAVILIDDVTEKIRLEEIMIQTEKMLSIGGLAAGMAHEINNPLAGMLQNLQVIKNRLLNSIPKNVNTAIECGTSLEAIQSYIEKRKISDMFEMVNDSGQRAAKIVTNMLNFSRKSETDYQPHDLIQLLNDTVELALNDYDLKKQFDFRKIKIIREYPSDLPQVWCDKIQIQQVLLNLLKNAAQAMWKPEEHLQAANHSSSTKPRLTLRLKNAIEMLQIEIEDNGPGMTEDIRKRLFEPFFTTKKVGIGTGLGLSVSFFIIKENHKGTITVESEPDKGTTFIIHLPFQQS